MVRGVSISMAIMHVIMLFGLHVGTHFCMGHAVETAVYLGEHSLSCGMEADKTCAGEGTFIAGSDCCEDVSLELQVEDSYQKTEKPVLNLNLSADFVSIETVEFAFEYVSDQPAPTQSPPNTTLLSRRLSLHQIYLI